MFFMVSVVVYAIALFQSIRAYESLREAILVDARIPKKASLGKTDPLNPLIYEPPSIK